MEKQECRGSTFVLCTLCSTFLYAICAGFRDNFGIMLPAIVAERGLSYATVSFIIALGQLFFGLMQPVFGFLSVRKSPRFVLFSGIFLMLAGLAISAVTHSATMLTIAMGILLPSGTAAASFGIIMSCLLPVFSDRQAHTASGFIAAGIGLSICLLAPLLQYSLASRGLATTLFLLSTPIVLLLPVAIFLTHVGKATMKIVESTKESFADMLRLSCIPSLQTCFLRLFHLRIPYGSHSDPSFLPADCLRNSGQARLLGTFHIRPGCHSRFHQQRYGLPALSHGTHSWMPV